MDQYIFAFIFFIVFLFFGYREYLARGERQELVDRLMSKDLPEFKAYSEKPEKPKKEKPSPFVDIDSVEAREDLL